MLGGRILLGALAAALAGCYAPAYRDCDLTCASGTCPSGFVCDLGVCRVEGFTGTCGVTGDGDGGIDGNAGDAAVPTCDVAAPFGSPVPVMGVNHASAVDATLHATADELLAYFYTTRDDFTGGTMSDIYVATRSTLTDSFVVVPAIELNTTSVDSRPAISGDGKMMVFTSDRPGTSGGLDLWLATRQTLGDKFVVAGPIASLNSTANDLEASFRSGTNELYFTSNRSGSDAIYRTTFSATTFATPTSISELELATSTDGSPVVSRDGLSIWFHSNRGGAANGLDVWRATRQTTSDPFGGIVQETVLNSGVNDAPTWLSPDGCRLYLTSGRSGGHDIFVATRPNL